MDKSITIDGRQYRVGFCEYCGNGYKKTGRGKPYKFCSRYCSVRGMDGNSRFNRKVRNCDFCGKEYEYKNKQSSETKYCSKSCLIKGRDYDGERNPNWSNAGDKICESCGKPYNSYSKTRRYCGINCSHIHAASEAMRNGARGYAAELKCCEKMDSCGFITFRSAASRGPFDVIAIGDGGTYWIQVKRTKNEARRMHQSEIKKLQQIPMPHDKCFKQMWVWIDRKGWFFIHFFSDESYESWWEYEASFDKYSKVPSANLVRQYAIDLRGDVSE